MSLHESTRLTYRHRSLSRDIVASFAKRRTAGAPAVALADFLVRLYGQTPQSHPQGSLQRRALDVVWAASGSNGAEPPTRHAYACAALHLAERMLGFGEGGRFSEERRRNSDCGTYSTPDFIARTMLRDIRHLDRGSRRPLDVLDLSVEAGQFPLSALHNQRPSSRPLRYYAIDRDPVALSLAKRIVAFAATEPTGPFEFKTTRRDSLLDPLPRSWPSRFDLVLGNPPWQGRHWSAFEPIRQRFSPRLDGRVDTYLAFMLRAHELLKPGGYLSMVVPHPFLFNRNAAPLRQLLVDEYDILTLRLYPQGSFVEVFTLVPISFVAQKRAPRARRRTHALVSYVPGPVGDRARAADRRVPTRSWRLNGYVMNPIGGPHVRFLMKPLAERRLADFGVLWSGGRLTRAVMAPAPRFAGVHGRDIRPFHVCEKRLGIYARHVYFDRPPRLDLLERRKVVFQDMRNPTQAERLIAATAQPGSYPVSTASMFAPEDQADVAFFEALLNSSFANAWYKARDVSRSIKLGWLAELPIIVDPTTWARVAELGRQAALVRRFYHRRLPACMTRYTSPTPYPEMDARLAECRRRLDAEIFNLYGFSDRQRRTIETLSITKVF